MATKEWQDMRGEYIDSREIIERLEELESAAAEEPSDFGCTYCQEGSMPSDKYPSLCVDHGDELAILVNFRDQGEGFADWAYGESFIPDDSFEDYARELADEIGAVDSNAAWPNTYIDWERAADALRQDYTAIEVDGVTYLGRA